MRYERVLILLMSLTVVLQALTLFKRSGTAVATVSQEQRPPVVAAPPGTAIDLEGLPVRGDTKAKVVLVEFSDYECPFCAKHATGVGKQVHQQFIMTGKVQHAFANNPLEMHSNATLLATAAICAGEQNHYWEMHDAIFTEKARAKAELVQIAKRLELDTSKLEKCLEATEPATRIEKDSAKAQELQFRGTPTFAVGTVKPNGEVSIEKIISGAQPFGIFEKTLNDAIKASS